MWLFCYWPSSFTSKLWHDYMLGFKSQQSIDLCKDVYIQWGCYYVCYHGSQLSSGAAGVLLSLLHHDGNWGHCGFNNVFVLFLSVKTMQLYSMRSHSCMPHYPAFRVLPVSYWGGGGGWLARVSDLDYSLVYVDSNKVVIRLSWALCINNTSTLNCCIELTLET